MAITNATMPSAGTGAAHNGPIDLPSTSRWSESNMAASSDGLVTHVVQRAHDTIDQFAAKAAPQVQRLQDGLGSAGDTLQEQADQARAAGGMWVQSLRTSVRDHPLTAVGSALALGALIARIIR